MLTTTMEKGEGILRHWKITRDKDDILLLQIDRADASVNTLSGEIIEELDRALDNIRRDPPAGLIVGSAKTNGFVAGADVREFLSISDAKEAQSRIERVHGLLDRIERLPFPTACLVHGFCLGGGLELALAFGSIIAVDSPETRLGLPEVNLGIHPGFGGTARMVQRIGPLRALDLMLTGRSLDARRALQIGLVDAVAPERQGLNTARTMIRKTRPGRKSRRLHSLLRLWPCRLLLGRYLRRVVARRADRNHYPAPYALLDLWEKHGGSQQSMDRAEARSVARLIVSENSRNLVRVFRLRERLQSLGRRSTSRAHSVHVIGGGIMGGDIAAWCALQGFQVTIQDIEPQRLAGAIQRASVFFHTKLKDNRMVDAALARMAPDLSGEGVSRADVVIEAIFEDAAAKRKMYEEIEPRMRRDALLATNTSGIPLESLSPSLRFPQRFAGLHFFNPVAKMPLVEVVRGKDMDEASFREAVAFVSAIRRLPLPVSSSPGFLINRILTPYLLEAFLMEQEGIQASAIDGAARAFGMPMGPLQLADSVGLDICLAVGRNLGAYLGLEVPKNLENLVGAGRLGKKTRRGFYSYRNGKPLIFGRPGMDPGSEALSDRLVLRLLNEAVACLREHLVEDADLLDAGAVFGMGFAPFRGGPANYIRSKGAAWFESRLRRYESQWGRRFAPDPGWSAFAESPCEPGNIEKASGLEAPGKDGQSYDPK